jgi:hypothetical protein
MEKAISKLVQPYLHSLPSKSFIQCVKKFAEEDLYGLDEHMRRKITQLVYGKCKGRSCSRKSYESSTRSFTRRLTLITATKKELRKATLAPATSM